MMTAHTNLRRAEDEFCVSDQLRPRTAGEPYQTLRWTRIGPMTLSSFEQRHRIEITLRARP